MGRNMLTDITIRTAKPTAKPYKLTDGRGLYLRVTATGKLWRFDYRFEGRRKTLALGQHPEITLKKARDKREAARAQLADGVLTRPQHGRLRNAPRPAPSHSRPWPVSGSSSSGRTWPRAIRASWPGDSTTI
jgi:hypothetical protein